jgi:hypothetical protein
MIDRPRRQPTALEIIGRLQWRVARTMPCRTGGADRTGVLGGGTLVVAQRRGQLNN